MIVGLLPRLAFWYSNLRALDLEIYRYVVCSGSDEIRAVPIELLPGEDIWWMKDTLAVLYCLGRYPPQGDLSG